MRFTDYYNLAGRITALVKTAAPARFYGSLMLALFVLIFLFVRARISCFDESNFRCRGTIFRWLRVGPTVRGNPL